MGRHRIPLLALSLVVLGCQTKAPTLSSSPSEGVINGGIKPNTANPGSPRPVPSAQKANTGNVVGQVAIHGQVLLSDKLLKAYRIASVTATPTANATVELRSFANPLFLVQSGATSDAGGNFKFSTSASDQALFLRAVLNVNGQQVVAYAPVPQEGDNDITVNIDLESTLLFQYLLGRKTANPGALPVLLQPDNVKSLHDGIAGAVTDANAPDLRNPTQVFDTLESLRTGSLAPTFSKVEAGLPQPSPAAPLPSPITVTPAAPVPGPSMGDPPIFTGSGSTVTGAPKPASYLSQAFTAMQQPGHMAAIRFTTLDEVFMAAIDQKDGSLFAFFRDNGGPTHFSASALTLTGATGVALDKSQHALVVGPSKLVRLTVALGPKLTTVETVTQGNAIAKAVDVAVNADGTAAYVANSDGSVIKFAVPSGTQDTTFNVKAPGTATAVALGPDGKVYVALSTGTIAQYNADGSVANASYASVPGATALSVHQLGSLYVGADKQVFRVPVGKAAESFMKTPDPVTGLAILGGYLYLTEGSGNLDSLTTGE